MAFQISHFTSNGSIFYDLHSITHIFYIFFLQNINKLSWSYRTSMHFKYQ